MDNTTDWVKEIVINPSSPRPLYLQVKEGLETWIVNSLHEGNICPGDRLPSENELSEKLKISPITIKRALDDLRRQGLLYRVQGKGTYVADQSKIPLPLSRLFSLTNLTLEKGMMPVRKTLLIAEQSATPRLAQRLNISPDSNVIKLVRLRSMDNIPIVVETTFLPAPLFPNFISIYSDHISLYELIATHYGQEVVRAQDLIYPVLVRSYEASLLEVPTGAMAFLFQRLAYNAEGQPLESTKSIIRSDLICISVEHVKDTYEPSAKSSV